jgi:hypothetical protein
MTDELNIFETTHWERDLGPARGTRVGTAAGARELGCALYELDPGGQAVPYHAHYGNEEMLIVLEGTVELRTPRRDPGSDEGRGGGIPGWFKRRASVSQRLRSHRAVPNGLDHEIP